MRRPIRTLSISLVALALVAAGCSKNNGQGESSAPSSKGKTSSATLVNDAKGPAPAVKGAKSGGQVLMYEGGDFEHLDPQRNYVIPSLVLGTALLYRSLTTYRETGDGKLEVVGDLATDTGEESNGGKTWTFHLRDNIKYEDGSAITSQDIAYGVARSFSPDLSEGPHWIQQWLAGSPAYNDKYKGPYNGASKLPPGVTTPDAKTIVFNFPEPEPDLPYAATMGTTTPVPAAKDTKVQYDNRPFSSGPYKIQSYVRNQSMVLVKNTYWDPNSDVTRHQYPDTYKVDFTRTADQANNAMISDVGADQTAFAPEDLAIPADLYPKVVSTPAVKARLLQGPTVFVWQLNFNTQRVTDLKVRQAMNYAIDKTGFLKVWGSYLGTAASTILSPNISGYQKYDAYNGGATGDVAKAKQLLGNKRVKLVYAYRNTTRNQQIAAFLQSSLKPAGFDITIQPVDKDQWYTQIGKKNNVFDFYLTGWGSDWPSANTVLPVLFNGAAITPEGNSNYSYLNEPDVNAEIVRIQKETNLSQAAKDWAALDKKIMTEYAPEVPVVYDVQSTLYGSKLGGTFLSEAYGSMGMTSLYVK